MEKIIQELEAKIDQIAGELSSEFELPEWRLQDWEIKTLEQQAETYQSMVKMCKAMQDLVKVANNK